MEGVIDDVAANLLKAHRELIELERDEGYLPWNMSIHPGCDCGCGGDTEDWDAAREDAARIEARQTVLNVYVRELLTALLDYRVDIGAVLPAYPEEVDDAQEQTSS